MLGAGSEIVGRDVELASIARFLRDVGQDGAGALLLEGELGIGKTTVWRAGLGLARDEGYRVMPPFM